MAPARSRCPPGHPWLGGWPGARARSGEGACESAFFRVVCKGVSWAFKSRQPYSSNCALHLLRAARLVAPTGLRPTALTHCDTALDAHAHLLSHFRLCRRELYQRRSSQEVPVIYYRHVDELLLCNPEVCSPASEQFVPAGRDFDLPRHVSRYSGVIPRWCVSRF